MTKFTLIHNPKCSKSRATLQILNEHNIEPNIFLYLEEKIESDFLKSLFKALGKKPGECLRTKEDEFKALSLDTENDDEVIEAIIKFPKILERPILYDGKRAAIGRPPENILELIV